MCINCIIKHLCMCVYTHTYTQIWAHNDIQKHWYVHTHWHTYIVAILRLIMNKYNIPPQASNFLHIVIKYSSDVWDETQQHYYCRIWQWILLLLVSCIINNIWTEMSVHHKLLCVLMSTKQLYREIIEEAERNVFSFSWMVRDQ